MSYASALPLVLIFSVGSLFVAWFLARWVLAKDTGTEAMQKISNAIKEGAEAFLRRQNRTIVLLASLLAVVIFLLWTQGAVVNAWITYATGFAALIPAVLKLLELFRNGPEVR